MQANFRPIESGMRPYDDAEPVLSAMYDFWLSKCRGGRLPGRRDMDMVEIPRAMLPLMMMLDVEKKAGAAGRRFRYRLIGTQIAQYAGRDFTGHYLDEVIPPERAVELVASINATIDTRLPNTLASPYAFPNRDFNHVRRLFLPLATDGTQVDIVINCFSFKSVPEPTR